MLPLRSVKEVTSIGSADCSLKVVELRALHVTYPLHEDHASFKKAPRDRTRDHKSPQFFSDPLELQTSILEASEASEASKASEASMPRQKASSKQNKIMTDGCEDTGSIYHISSSLLTE